jgi:hypothetical protein
VTYLKAFTKLNLNNHKPTSPQTAMYNCIAWAAGDDQQWWEPASRLGYYWPPGATAGYDSDSLIAAFAAIGYELCADGSHVVGVEKVALYSKADNRWSHAARQLPSGKWTSKLGKSEDIEHESPDLISGKFYGAVYCFMARKL